MTPRKNTTENGFALSFGKWEGPEQGVEEIKDEIKSGRKFKKKNCDLLIGATDIKNNLMPVTDNLKEFECPEDIRSRQDSLFEHRK